MLHFRDRIVKGYWNFLFVQDCFYEEVGFRHEIPFLFCFGVYLFSIFIQGINTFNYLLLLSLHQSNFLVYQLSLFRIKVVILLLSDFFKYSYVPTVCKFTVFQKITRKIFLASFQQTIAYWRWALILRHIDLEKVQRWCQKPCKNWCALGFCEETRQKTDQQQIYQMRKIFLSFEHSESTNSPYCTFASSALSVVNIFNLNNVSARAWNLNVDIYFSLTIAFGDKEEEFLITAYLSRHLSCNFCKSAMAISMHSFYWLFFFWSTFHLKKVITLRLF